MQVVLVNIRRTRSNQFTAVHECRGTASEAPSSFAGREVVESLSLPRGLSGYMSVDDLKPDLYSQHRGSIRYILERITTGYSGTFHVTSNGRFSDFHGGSGFKNTDDMLWFTDRAMRRGIAWFTDQIYRCNGDIVGRFRIIRQMSLSGGFEVRKEVI